MGGAALDMMQTLDAPPRQEQVEQPQDDESLPWYLRDADSVVATLTDEKQDDYYNALSTRGIWQQMRIAWAYYYGTDPDRPGEMATQQLKRVGQEKEFTRLRINEFRSFVKQAIQTATGIRPAFKAVTESSNFEVLAGIEAADRGIKHVMDVCYDDGKRRRYLERAMVLGASFAHIRWDKEAGEDSEEEVPVIDPNTQQQVVGAMGIPVTDMQDVKTGEPGIDVGCPWECYYDVEEENEPRWIVVKEKRSRWELMQLFPERAEDLRSLTEETRHGKESVFGVSFEAKSSDDDKLTLHHAYFDVCIGAEKGRYIGFVEGSDHLWDRELPVEAKGMLPVVLLMPAPYIGMQVGYADHWDIISLNQAINNVASDWMSNARAFGRLNMVGPKGAGINFEAARQGLSFLEVNPGQAGEVQFLVPPKLDFGESLLNYLHRRTESVTQQNAVRRGDPQANIKSGTMAALFNQQSIEYSSDVQQAFDNAERKIANIVFEMVRTRSKGSYMVLVAGESERPYWEAFSKKQLKGIRSIHFEPVSPQMRSPAGRVEAFNVISQVPEDRRGAVLRGLDKGDWSGYVQTDVATDMRIVRENELLLQAKQVMVGAGDRHHIHVPAHQSEFDRLEAADPTIIGPPPIDPMTGQPAVDPMTGQPLPGQPIPGKYDAQKRALLTHILGHTEQWQYMDPRLAALLQIPPPPPMPGTPSGDLMMMTGGGGAPPAPGPEGAPPEGEMPDDGSAPPEGQPPLPEPAEPAQPPTEGAPA